MAVDIQGGDPENVRSVMRMRFQQKSFAAMLSSSRALKGSQGPHRRKVHDIYFDALKVHLN